MDSNKNNEELSWREFQDQFISKKKKKVFYSKTLKKILFCSIVVLFTFAAFISFTYLTFSKNSDTLSKITNDSIKKKSSPKKTIHLISKPEVKKILGNTRLINSDRNVFFIDSENKSLKLTTSLDIDLQEFLLEQMTLLKKRSRGKPRRIAFVVMEPDSGKIIALAGFDLENPDINPCFQSDFPAASIFKIVTAAAAVESLGYNPSTQLYFNGSKYTLYRRQLKNVKNKYTSKISFSKAFAQSINPVFGKLGKNHIKGELLLEYAQAFGFNDQIESEICFDSGFINVSQEPYQWAELASGFNRDTTISPVFGALLASTIINFGKTPVPIMVEHITDSDGNIVYENKPSVYRTAIKPHTAKTVTKLMQTTISKGTAKKTFRGASKHRTLSKLIIGGKTGSLYNKKRTIKYDWFIGFGKEKSSSRAIAVSVVVGHGKYYGTKACKFGKMILEQYYKDDIKTAKL